MNVRIIGAYRFTGSWSKIDFNKINLAILGRLTRVKDKSRHAYDCILAGDLLLHTEKSNY